jgi:hypothetical protein
MGKDYKLTPDQQANISVGEVAQRIVEILQRNLSAGPDYRGPRSYYGSQMSSIRQFEFLDEPEFRLGWPNPKFQHVFQQAVDRLYHEGLIYPEPGQNPSDFFLLTEKGWAADPSRPVVGQTGSHNPVTGGTQNGIGGESDMSAASTYAYDVALSFAGEDRDHADRLARLLDESGVKVFYDDFERADLWGKNLAEHLHRVYSKTARYCVVFVSKSYADKAWPRHELRSALERAIQQMGSEYVLPIRLDDTELPGLQSTVAYVPIGLGIDHIHSLLMRKLGMTSTSIP